MKHLKIRSVDEVSDDILAPYVRQAVELNRAQGNPARQAPGGGAPRDEVATDAVPLIVSVEPAPAESGTGPIPPSADDGWDSESSFQP
jgi:hypothetical protein